MLFSVQTIYRLGMASEILVQGECASLRAQILGDVPQLSVI